MMPAELPLAPRLDFAASSVFQRPRRPGVVHRLFGAKTTEYGQRRARARFRTRLTQTTARFSPSHARVHNVTDITVDPAVDWRATLLRRQ